MQTKPFGWAGKMLRIDLSSGEIRTESTDAYARQFIGGRGVHQWIIFKEVPPGTQPFDSDNLLLFGNGPLSGTRAPSPNFTAVSSLNVYNGGTNFAHVGGHFGPELKFAGYDHIIIRGKAKTPVYLRIDDDTVELLDASHLWGKWVSETERIIRQTYSDKKIRIASIGPAGENLVRSACIIVDKTRAAGGGGIGAVMGSKNLKAVAVRGHNKVRIAQPDAFDSCVKAALKKIKDTGITGAATIWTVAPMNDVCLMPVKNVEDDHWDEGKISRITSPEIDQHKSGELITACFNCPIGCGNHVYEIKAGPHAGLKERLYECSTAYSFGSRLDIDDFPALLKSFNLVSELGLDESNTGVVISWAVDCFQRGLLSGEETEGLNLEFGDPDLLLDLIQKIAYREGFGDILADGVVAAARKIGNGSDYYATQVKGQEFTDPVRAAKGWALGIMTATRAGRHLNGAPATEFQKLPPEIGQAVYGVPSAGDGSSYEGKAKLVWWYEQFKVIVDVLGMCYFTSWWAHPGMLGPEEYARLFGSATGVDISADDLMRIGLRIHNIEKAINTLHTNFGRQDDLPPEILTKEPVKSGPLKGEVLDMDQWNKMLDDYYSLHGWDPTTGLQTQKTLEELGLTEVAQTLEKHGKLNA